MGAFTMRLRGIALEPYFQQYTDIRELAPKRGEMFTRPDSPEPTEQFFASLTAPEHIQILGWLLEVSQFLHQNTGVESSINVSTTLLIDPEQREIMLRLLQAVPCRTTLEFNEVPEALTPEELNQFFDDLHALGHESALDSFGRGDPERDTLHNIHFDTIKLSGAVTIGSKRVTESQQRLEALCQAIHDAGRQHVVQGVEAQASFEWLKSVGFTTFQGYWFSIPKPVEQALQPER